ncbi:glycerol-3-phosphate transporter [Actinobacillus equuli subsp. haemolyticus]|uniref:Glycerol-3-phosphate transporter n=2 Tax=Actinobacillus equuli TaxID=718 RepID=A0A0A7MFH9_ACTEU|nr:glycerol-3-phosphate transporter [Actinobacillus equuli]AIZ79218.1 sn-glycerol-3-phosphate transporter [Actinobacillus equuli subsp. equuli]MDE8033656.1 glycerol-3-phosphate transporter [Actinobacillus equuli subsp. equuli]MDG4948272.1 glycerol-3-phosphate transporter [Actinobacillus equuli subsp. haemolyticus]WGE43209.1 glycerol-3-phosphate transporter [Actinobacillus equuli subsp. haemolyticus]WGE45456.1 glycerol-3-phosphate transporter [Actinobacillus equuli subsp. equuli]
MFGPFKPAPHIAELPADKIDERYKFLRWQVFAGIFFGYAAYYFVRANFDLAQKGLIEAGLYNKAELGIIGTGAGLAYGLSKFVMAWMSDRSNPKVFLPFGLLLSGLCMTMMGLMPWATSGIAVMFIMIFLNGWFQGMGWPPCGRTMVHWWSKSERGSIVSIWNCAHNVGGMVPGLMVFLAGAVYFNTTGVEATAKDVWQQALYYPGIAAMIAAIPIYFMMKDTPQSCGLPPVEKWRNDYPDNYDENKSEQELTTKEILVTYVLKNKLLWYIAIANVFVYLIRYGVLKWSPVYLGEVKHFNIKGTASAYIIYELAAIPGTLLCGWVSDKIFKGKRGLTGFIFMILTTAAVIALWLNPATPEAELAQYAGKAWYENPYQLMDFILMTTIGFLIYGPVMLIGLHALELAPKKAAGTSAGFTGLFGYLGGTVSASAVVGWAAHEFGWDGGFYVMITGGVLAVLLMLIVMLEEGKHKAKLGDHYGK